MQCTAIEEEEEEESITMQYRAVNFTTVQHSVESRVVGVQEYGIEH